MASQPVHSTPVKDNLTNDSSYESFGQKVDASANSSSGLILSDLEISTIEKQRKELQLLITELKDRDRELNEMVVAHQQQLTAWDRDRQRALFLERKNQKFEVELKKRCEQIRLLIQRIKISESKHKSKDTAIETAETRMKQMENDIHVTSNEVRDLKDKNSSLNTSLTDLSSKISTMEHKEQELQSILQIKDREIQETIDHSAVLTDKLRSLEAEHLDSQRTMNRLRSELHNEKLKYKQAESEIGHIKGELLEKTTEMLAAKREIVKLKEDIHKLQRESYIKDDELRRKDDLIDLQRSKQDRTDKELATIRLIYERQQQDLSSLRVNLSDSREVIARQEERLNHLCGFNLSDYSDCGSEATNDILDEARRSVLSDDNDAAPEDSSEEKLPFSSPTSKLQKLLEESRAMVHNLELAAAPNLPRPKSSAT